MGANPVLSGVSETLLLPLYARWRDNLSDAPLLPDPAVPALVARLGLDFSKYPESDGDLIGVAARSHILDDAARDVLSRHPEASVVNLGAGLCTRYERLGKPARTWIDMDLPEVEAPWRAAFEGRGKEFIPADVTDPTVWQDLRKKIDGPVLFIAEGLMMYLSESEMRRLLKTLSQLWPGSEILGEVMSPYFAARSKMHPTVKHTNAEFRWGISDAKEMENWEGDISVLGQWAYMEWTPPDGQRLPKLPLFFRIISLFPAVRRAFRVIHLQLGQESKA